MQKTTMFSHLIELGEIGCDTLINQQDFLGVNLIAIQALEKRTQRLQLENEQVKKQNEELQKTNAEQKELNEELLKGLDKIESSISKKSVL